jgi:hypothetical protein
LRVQYYIAGKDYNLTTNKGLRILESTIISHLVALSLEWLQAKAINARQESVAMERIVIVVVLLVEYNALTE